MMKRRKLEHNPEVHIWKLAKHNQGVLFSEDIMTEIFLWLPLKSLIRFKRLSKRWSFLITDQDNSYFRRNYLSTLSSRRRNKIVGRSDDDDDDNSAIMAGFFYQKKPEFVYWRIYDRARFLPSTSTQSQSQLITTKYSFLHDSPNSQEEEESTTPTTSSMVVNPAFLSLDESLDKFLSSCLHLNPDDPIVHESKFLVAGSSNGFLLLSLQSSTLCDNYYLLNPVTMEWLALPKREQANSYLYVGFVCKGDYPSLDLVEYTIVRFSWLEKQGVTLLFELFSSGDNEWSEYKVSCESLQVKFMLTGQHNTVIVSTTTTTTTNNQGGGGGGGGRCRILVYFLVMVQPTRTTAIAVFDLNKGDKSLQMIETPGADRGGYVLECEDYIREFDDGRVIHYVRLFHSTYFEFWVFNTESGEWHLKHKASLNGLKRYRWLDLLKWSIACNGVQKDARARFHIHAFHPLNPNLIFLTLFGKVVCYNVETGMLVLVYDFTTPQNNENIMDDYCHYVYQWPCWPPLL